LMRKLGLVQFLWLVWMIDFLLILWSLSGLDQMWTFLHSRYEPTG
jgi:hypothetical protein